MKKPRMCSRFFCDRMHDRFCCRDCGRYVSCDNACLNHPSRCGLEDLSGRVRREETVRVRRGAKGKET